MEPSVLALLSSAPPVEEDFLAQELARSKVTLAAGMRPFVESKELERRYGVPLPAGLLDLWRLADERMIERVKLSGFRYVRVAPGGWEPPETSETWPFFGGTLQRFEWNTFSNMQLLERLAGLAPLGWDAGDHRLEVATCHPDAPVFWLNHETADLLEAGCVAHSLDRFLRVHCGDEAGLTPQEVALAQDGSSWTRETDGYAYLPARGPLRQWPPFLWARHAWLVAELCLGSAREHLEDPEVYAYDFAAEQPFLSQSEPLALYWLLRSLVLDDAPTLERASQLTVEHPSPLVRAVGRFVRETPTLNPEGLFAKARARAASYRAVLMLPQGGTFDAARF